MKTVGANGLKGVTKIFCKLLGIDEKTFTRARSELKNKGLIDFIPASKKGEYTKYFIVKLYPV